MPLNDPFRKYTLDSSPVSFVVTGPNELHRHVMISSSDKNLDLVGLDSRFVQEITTDQRRPTVINSIFAISKPELVPFVVRSRSKFHIGDNGNDKRSGSISFIWRGLAERNDIDLVQQILEETSIDLMNAYESGKVENIEWQMSQILAVANQVTQSNIRRYLSLRNSIISVAIIYAIIGLIAVAVYLIKFPKL